MTYILTKILPWIFLYSVDKFGFTSDVIIFATYSIGSYKTIIFALETEGTEDYGLHGSTCPDFGKHDSG